MDVALGRLSASRVAARQKEIRMDGSTDVTQILSQIQAGDPSAAEQLLPVVYDELRKLASARFAHEKPGQTLQATALVHEAYIRLVDVENAQQWDSRGHFFGAAAEAIRRILVENAQEGTRPARGWPQTHRPGAGHLVGKRTGRWDTRIGRGVIQVCGSGTDESGTVEAPLFRGFLDQ